MRVMIALFLAFLFTIHEDSALAASSTHGITYTIEPIVGFTQSQRTVPTPHIKTLFIYGGRIVAGHRLFSLEGEYTRGSDHETFASPTLNINDTREMIKVGVRSRLWALPSLDLILRAGGQASRDVLQQTDASGVTTTTGKKFEYHPYLGAGLEYRVMHLFSLSAEAVYVLHSTQEMNKNEVQTTLAFKLNL